MKYLPIGLLAVMFTAQTLVAQTKWVAPADQRNVYNPLANNTRVLPEAKKLYATMCISCHGADGKGDGEKGVSLNPKPADYTAKSVKKETDGSLYWKMSTGNGEMKPFGHKLSEEQRWSLVSYIRTFQ